MSEAERRAVSRRNFFKDVLAAGAAIASSAAWPKKVVAQSVTLPLGADGLPADPVIRAVTIEMQRLLSGGRDTELHQAVRDGDVGQVAMILNDLDAASLIIDTPDTGGQTALYIAVKDRGNVQPAIIDALLNAGANPNALSITSERGGLVNGRPGIVVETPLHAAARNMDPEVVELLLDRDRAIQLQKPELLPNPLAVDNLGLLPVSQIDPLSVNGRMVRQLLEESTKRIGQTGPNPRRK